MGQVTHPCQRLILSVPENIRSRSVLPVEQLGSHVPGISLLDVPFHFLLNKIMAAFELQQQTEVGQLETTRGSDQDVSRLEVQVDEPVNMQVFQC